jgi:hypothetical protein
MNAVVAYFKLLPRDSPERLGSVPMAYAFRADHNLNKCCNKRHLLQTCCCFLYTKPHGNMAIILLPIRVIIVSRVWVTKDGVRIGNWIYWILTGRNYN